MASPSDFTNQARDRLMGVLGVRNNAPTSAAPITPAGFTAQARKGGGGGGGGGGQPGAAGRTCTNDRDCGQNTRCQAGVCVAKGGGGTTPGAGTGTGTTPAPGSGNACTKNSDCGGNKACINGTCQRPDQTQPGRQCTRGSDCPPGKNCVNGNCVDRGGGTKPPDEDTGRDCRRNRQCPNGKICNAETGKCEDRTPGGDDETGKCGNTKCSDNEQCVNDKCVPKTSGDSCGPGLPPCPSGQTCVGGVCTNPAEDGPLADSDPMTYMYNLAGANVMGAGPGLKMGSVNPFGRFLNNRFNDIVGQYEAESLTNNLSFRDWLRGKAEYGRPFLEMGDGPTVGVPGIVDPEVASTRAGGGNGCKSSADCTGGDKPFCVDGRCSATPQTLAIADYENITPFRNYLRNQYYGASAYDRGISPANFGAGSTRWSAW